MTLTIIVITTTVLALGQLLLAIWCKRQSRNLIRLQEQLVILQVIVRTMGDKLHDHFGINFDNPTKRYEEKERKPHG